MYIKNAIHFCTNQIRQADITGLIFTILICSLLRAQQATGIVAGMNWSMSIGDIIMMFLMDIKQRIIDICRQEWHAKAVHQCPEYLDYHPYPFRAPHRELIQSYIRALHIFFIQNFQSLKNNLLRLGITKILVIISVKKVSGIFVENEYYTCTLIVPIQDSDVRLKLSSG